MEKEEQVLSSILSIFDGLYAQDAHIEAMYRQPSEPIGDLYSIPCPWDRIGVDATQYVYERADVQLKNRLLTRKSLRHVHPRLAPQDVDHSMCCDLPDPIYIIAQKVTTLVRWRTSRLSFMHDHTCEFERVGKKGFECKCRTFEFSAKLLYMKIRTFVVENGTRTAKFKWGLHICTPYCTVHTEDGPSEVFHPGALLVAGIKMTFCDTSLKYHVCDSSCSMSKSKGTSGRSCPLSGTSYTAFVNSAEHYNKMTSLRMPAKGGTPSFDDLVQSRHNGYVYRGKLKDPLVRLQPYRPDWEKEADVFNKFLVPAERASHPLGAFPYWVVPRDQCLKAWPPTITRDDGSVVVDEEEKRRIIAELTELASLKMQPKALLSGESGPGRQNIRLSRRISLHQTQTRVTREQMVRSKLKTDSWVTRGAIHKRMSTIWCAIHKTARVFDVSDLPEAFYIVYSFLFSEHRINLEIERKAKTDSSYPIEYMQSLRSTTAGRINLHMWALCIALEILCYLSDVYSLVIDIGVIPDDLDKSDGFVYMALVEMFSPEPSMFIEQVSPASYLPISHILTESGCATLGWVHGTMSKLAEKTDINISRKANITSTLSVIFETAENMFGGFVYSCPSIPFQDVCEWTRAYTTGPRVVTDGVDKDDKFMGPMTESMVQFYLSNFCSAKREVSPFMSTISFRDDEQFAARRDRASKRGDLLKSALAMRAKHAPSNSSIADTSASEKEKAPRSKVRKGLDGGRKKLRE
jgi:hypothetical protein